MITIIRTIIRRIIKLKKTDYNHYKKKNKKKNNNKTLL